MEGGTIEERGAGMGKETQKERERERDRERGRELLAKLRGGEDRARARIYISGEGAHCW